MVKKEEVEVILCFFLFFVYLCKVDGMKQLESISCVCWHP